MSADFKQPSTNDSTATAQPPGAAASNPQPASDPSAGRQANGRFAKGNQFGPGNPYARQVAELRKQMLNAVTSEQIQAIILAMVQKAIEGSVPAARLVLSYTLGKPMESMNPDRMDQDEWRGMQEDSDMARQMELLVNTPKPELAVNIGRAVRVAATKKWGTILLDGFAHPEKYRDEVPELVVPRKRKANGKNGGQEACVASAATPWTEAEQVSVFGSAPSPNGKSGRHRSGGR